MLRNSSKRIISPRITSPSSTSEQWAAILRYDASRRDSAGTIYAPLSDSTPSNKTRRFSDYDSAIAKKQTRRFSLGDDLPDMPFDPNLSSVVQPRSSLGSSTLHPSNVDEKNYLPLARPATPPALKGDNAILVNREVERLRKRRLKAIQRHWRIYTGTAMLVVSSLCAFILAKYILAYLALSPANWLLSDSADGTSNNSPDSLLRILALVGVCASAVALLGVLSSGFYLRFSRQRSCGTLCVWLIAIISTTINIFLCVINLALISIWHKKYSTSAIAFAATRNVSLRCSGSWALDILWLAAQNSPQAKVDRDSLPTCRYDAKGTLQAYLVAGGIRLIMFAAFCTIWLICLNKYNRTLQLVEDSFEDLEESAEMHRLLMEVDEGKHSSNSQVDLQICTEKEHGMKEDTFEDLSTITSLVPPPKLNRFRWQQDSSMTEEAQGYGNVREQHENEPSAGTWSTGVVGQVWDALWDTKVTADRQQVAQDDVEECQLTPLHDRQATKLGVRGWFRTSEQVSEDDGKMVTLNDDPVQLPVHLRTPSQEKRANEGRHAATRLVKVREEEIIHEARRREEMRTIDQDHRLEFLASLSEVKEEGNKDRSSRYSSQSGGDDLPHMPELSAIVDSDDHSLAGDDDIFWQSSKGCEASSNQKGTSTTHLYVRTLGKLIRTMSAIESEGSQERADRGGRSDPSGSDGQLY